MKSALRILVVRVLILPVALFLLVGCAEPPASSHSYLALVGTYTTKTQSKGIYAFDFNAKTGKLTPKGVAAETPDPSWVAIHPNGKWAYAVNEAGKQSMVSAFALDAQSGNLTLLNQLPALGEDPCYLSFDKTDKFLLVANYISGNIAVFPILPNGKLGEHTALLQDTGNLGPDKKRQAGPHAHWVGLSAHNRFAYVADLGLDQILVYKFDVAKGTLAAPSSLADASSPKQDDAFSAILSPGTGPRHAAFSRDGNFTYVLGEMQSTVTVFANDDARRSLRSVQQISTLPTGFSGRNDAAEIALHPNGKWLYASNRGRDTIAVFSVDRHKGTLRYAGDFPTAGQEPRHFAIDPTGTYLLAENQNSNTIVIFRLDPATGALIPTGDVVSVPSPVCLAFFPTQ